jgi:tetratricopeptide (TPR) repeat protein
MTDDGDKREGEPCADLVAQGKYHEALEHLDRSIGEGRNDGLLYRERAQLHLFMGNTLLARADFDKTAALSAATFRTPGGRLQSDIEYNAIGVTYWVEGHKELAQAFWRYTTSSLLANHVSYSHGGGGIGAGLLLWFGAVHNHRDDDIELVRKLYENRQTSTHWAHSLKGWPGPIVQFFFAHIGEDDLLKSTEERQEQCEAHFAVAIRARMQRRYAASKKHLESAGALEPPETFYDFYNVWPFFLARFESFGLPGQ